MITALGVSFGAERAYLVQISRSGETVSVHAATSVAPARGETAGPAQVQRMGEALRGGIARLPVAAPRVGLALPTTWTFQHIFPAPVGSTPESLMERARWEIRAHLGEQASRTHAVSVVPIARGDMFLSIAYPKAIVERVNDLLAAVGVSVVAVESVVFSAQRAGAWNYADLGNAPLALVECGGGSGHAAIVAAGKVCALREQIPLRQASEAMASIRSADASLDRPAVEILAWGEALSRDMLDGIAQGAAPRRVRRLNAFRNTSPAALSDRERLYCSRAAHVFPGAFGVALAALDRPERPTS